MCYDKTGSSDGRRLANPCPIGYFCPVNTRGPLPPQPSDSLLFEEKICQDYCRPPKPIVSDQCRITVTMPTQDWAIPTLFSLEYSGSTVKFDQFTAPKVLQDLIEKELHTFINQREYSHVRGAV